MNATEQWWADALTQDLWRRAAGMNERTLLPSLAELRQAEWSERFEKLMRNRLTMGAFRYGPMESKDLSRWDCVGDAVRRLAKFRADTNPEHLVDAANLLLLAFVELERQGVTMQANDDGEHAVMVR